MAYGTVSADVIQSSVSGVSLGAGNSSLMKNRLINSAMVIDQRYAGTAFGTSINGYTVDRWAMLQSTTGKLNGAQNWASVTTPVGFTNYLGFASQSAYSVAAGDYYVVTQAIEGFNIADLSWGTANAKTVTLSFQVQSSLTGTFGGSLQNNGSTRSYPFTYSIPVANTWTTVSVTIAGDTTGTWLTNNGIGIRVSFGLGVGATYSGTAGSWAGTNYLSATGATSVVGTNGATFYITGVQLEVGSSATGFEYRQYQQELALCQRYYYLLASGNGLAIGNGNNYSATQLNCVINFPISMRASPTLNATSGTDYYTFARNGTSDTFNSFTIFAAGTNASGIYNATEISGTAGQAGWILTNNSASSIAFQSEL